MRETSNCHLPCAVPGPLPAPRDDGEGSPNPEDPLIAHARTPSADWPSGVPIIINGGWVHRIGFRDERRRRETNKIRTNAALCVVYGVSHVAPEHRYNPRWATCPSKLLVKSHVYLLTPRT